MATDLLISYYDILLKVNYGNYIVTFRLLFGDPVTEATPVNFITEKADLSLWITAVFPQFYGKTW